MKVLVTGGAGYIGSHTVVELVAAGHDVVVYDNLVNASAKAVERVREITGTDVPLVEADVRDASTVGEALTAHGIEAVLHLAGLKAVGESVEKPTLYYENNVGGTLALVDAMIAHDVTKLVFSSSATVYGEDAPVPYRESWPVGQGIANPYGRTKHVVEEVLRDVVRANPAWQVSLLRYFNPIGAHPSGLIGEDPTGVPNNLVPFVSQVAVGLRDRVRIFGDDYPTIDGTGVRDYLHVVDVAKGHVAALERLGAPGSARTYNLGAGHGASVREVIAAYEQACGHPLPTEVLPRRDGDIAAFWADPSLAAAELGWKAELSLLDACRDAWAWQSKNPNGYAG